MAGLAHPYDRRSFGNVPPSVVNGVEEVFETFINVLYGIPFNNIYHENDDVFLNIHVKTNSFVMAHVGKNVGSIFRLNIGIIILKGIKGDFVSITKRTVF